MSCRSLSDDLDLESDLTQFVVVENSPTVEDERRFQHLRVDFFVVKASENVPFGAQSDGMSLLRGFIRTGMDLNLLEDG